MKMAQKAPEKVQKIIDDNKKIDILVAFKAAYPDASIVFNEPKAIEDVVVEEDLEALAKEAADAIEAEELAKADAEKEAKKAELQAQLDALDG